jgi:AcrR family transcriptional regulator
LILVATHLFGKYGYDDTGLDDITEAAHVTKGALYHHFENKQALFRAVYEELGHQLRVALDREVPERAPGPGGWTRFTSAVCLFLRIAAEPHIHQIRCVDGPAVLARPGSLNVEGRGLQTFRDAIAEAIEFGEIRAVPIESTARMLQAAMTEGAGYVAHATDFDDALADATSTLQAILDGLRMPAVTGQVQRLHSAGP